MIDKSIKGLVSRNEELLLEVLDQDEPKANRFELDIDEALHQPDSAVSAHGKGIAHDPGGVRHERRT